LLQHNISPNSTDVYVRTQDGTLFLDYPERKFYQIDWKVCALKWQTEHYGQTAQYVAFVEDDSFTCVENLLHQCEKLSGAIHAPFRTGWIQVCFQCSPPPHPPTHTRAHNGIDIHAVQGTAAMHLHGQPKSDFLFDDSSTFMTGDLALVMAEHYTRKENGLLYCNHSSTAENPWGDNKGELNKTLAWGPAWGLCGWRDLFLKNFGIKYNTPPMITGGNWHKLKHPWSNGRGLVLHTNNFRGLVFGTHYFDDLANATWVPEAKFTPHMCEYGLFYGEFHTVFVFMCTAA
jgi:hypothetical protein